MQFGKPHINSYPCVTYCSLINHIAPNNLPLYLIFLSLSPSSKHPATLIHQFCSGSGSASSGTSALPITHARTHPHMAEQTLNIPQLLAVILVGFVIIRWFFYSSSSNSNSNSNDPRPQDSRNAGRRADPRHVDQIAQMFPQIGRREIQWDLQRNGGSPAATTERILSGRGLEVVSFLGKKGGSLGGEGRYVVYASLLVDEMLTIMAFSFSHRHRSNLNQHLTLRPQVPLLRHLRSRLIQISSHATI